jgi:hypothetical protein
MPNHPPLLLLLLLLLLVCVLGHCCWLCFDPPPLLPLLPPHAPRAGPPPLPRATRACGPFFVVISEEMVFVRHLLATCYVCTRAIIK